MSITFTAQTLEPEYVPCTFEGCTPDTRCGYCYDGQELSDVGCNFSNTNALNLLRLLGYTPEPCGDWAAERIPAVRRAVLEAMNSTLTRKSAVREPAIIQDGRGPTVIICGTDDESVLNRLAQLDCVLAYAETHNLCVNWG